MPSGSARIGGGNRLAVSSVSFHGTRLARVLGGNGGRRKSTGGDGRGGTVNGQERATFRGKNLLTQLCVADVTQAPSVPAAGRYPV